MNMTYMLKLFSPLWMSFLFGSCAQEEIPSTQNSNDNLDPVVWKFDNKKLELPSNNFIHDTILIQGLLSEDSTFKVLGLSINSGNLIWEQKNFPYNFNAFSIEASHQSGNLIVFSGRNNTVVLNSNNGEILWQDYFSNFETRSCIIGDYVYRAAYYSAGKSELHRYHIQTGQREFLFEINTSNHGDSLFVPSLKMPLGWMNSNNEECIILHNRGYWKTGDKERMDIMCWNLTTKNMDWYRKGLDDWASNARPVIDQNRVYFLSVSKAFCIDPHNGQTIWSFEKHSTDLYSGFKFISPIVVKGILIAKSQSEWMYGINQYTGSLAWYNDNSSGTPSRMTVHNDTIWYSSAGIWAFNVSTGQTILSKWRRPAPGGYWGNPIVHHPTLNYLYTCDGRNIYCLDKSKMF